MPLKILVQVQSSQLPTSALQNSFTAVKSSKFPTKPILGYPPHLKYVAALPWKT